MQKAIELGIDRVEFDIQETRDGELIIFHDDVIQYQGTRKKVSTFARNELLQIENKAPDEIPTLESVLDACRGKIKIQAELKADGIESQVSTGIVTSGIPVPDVSISSFNIDRLVLIKSITSILEDVQLVLLLGKKLAITPALDEMVAMGIGSISIFAQDTTSQIVEQIHDRGMRVMAWGLGEKGLKPDNIIKLYRLLLNKGVDGFTCAYPDMLQRLIRESNS